MNKHLIEVYVYFWSLLFILSNNSCEIFQPIQNFSGLEVLIQQCELDRWSIHMPHSCRCCCEPTPIWFPLFDPLRTDTSKKMDLDWMDQVAHKGSLCCELYLGTRTQHQRTHMSAVCWSSFRVRAFVWFIKSGRAHPAEQRNNFFPGPCINATLSSVLHQESTRRMMLRCGAAAAGPSVREVKCASSRMVQIHIAPRLLHFVQN